MHFYFASFSGEEERSEKDGDITSHEIGQGKLDRGFS